MQRWKFWCPKTNCEDEKNTLHGIRTEILAGKALIIKNTDDKVWNEACDRAIRIVDQYIAGEGLFQQKDVEGD